MTQKDIDNLNLKRKIRYCKKRKTPIMPWEYSTTKCGNYETRAGGGLSESCKYCKHSRG